LSCTRTAGRELPPTLTSPTPPICAIFCASTVEAMSYSAPCGRFGDDSASARIGDCDGLTLRKLGLPGMPAGSSLRAALIAAWTSRAASSMLRPISNSRRMLVRPCRLSDPMAVTPLMLPSARSSGVATVAAMLSGLAPGSEALTTMFGNSTCGSDATGSARHAMRPHDTSATASRTLATGRRMNGRARFTFRSAPPPARHCGCARAGRRTGTPPAS
jgi:hypothetical protein